MFKKHGELLLGLLIALIVIGWITTGQSGSGGAPRGPAVTAPARGR